MTENSAISFASDGVGMNGYLSRPDGAGPFPALLVIHEIFGLNDNIRGIADRFATEGYLAMAPNLYSRPGGIARFCVTQMVKAFATHSINQQAIRDLNAAVAYLQGLEDVRSEGIDVVGFCLGGGYALMLACTSHDVKASVVFYGRNPSPIDVVADIECPVMYLYGENDRFVRRDVPELKAAMRANGKSFDITAYPGAGHSFMNDRRRSYRPDVAEDAWPRILKFFADNVGAASE